MPKERACVLAEAAPRDHLRLPPADFTPSLLAGGTRWIGGDVRRVALYRDGGGVGEQR